MANQVEEPFPLLGISTPKEMAPPTYTPDPPQYTPGRFHYTPGPSQYTPGPSQYTSQYTPGPSQYTSDPSQYTSNPSQCTSDPSQYTSGPPQYTPCPSWYTPGSSQHPPNQSQYSPYPRAAPVCTPASQQQSSSNVVVVNSQPSAAQSTVIVRSTRDHYLTLSIILTVVCCFCIGCGWLSLFCTIPAILVSLSARSDEEGNRITIAKRKASVSVCLNVASVFMFVFVVIALVVAPIVFFVVLGKSLQDIWHTSSPTSIATTLRPTPTPSICFNYISGYYQPGYYYQPAYYLPGYQYYFLC